MSGKRKCTVSMTSEPKLFFCQSYFYPTSGLFHSVVKNFWATFLPSIIVMDIMASDRQNHCNTACDFVNLGQCHWMVSQQKFPCPKSYSYHIWFITWSCFWLKWKVQDATVKMEAMAAEMVENSLQKWIVNIFLGADGHGHSTKTTSSTSFWS